MEKVNVITILPQLIQYHQASQLTQKCPDQFNGYFDLFQQSTYGFTFQNTTPTYHKTIAEKKNYSLYPIFHLNKCKNQASVSHDKHPSNTLICCYLLRS